MYQLMSFLTVAGVVGLFALATHTATSRRYPNTMLFVWGLLTVALHVAGPGQYVFPSVFNGDKIATYEKDRVVELPRGGSRYTYKEIFRIPTEPVNWYLSRSIVVISLKPYAELDAILVNIEVIDENRLYEPKVAREIGWDRAYWLPLNILAKTAQEELFREQIKSGNTVMNRRDCQESTFYKDVATRMNQVTETYGLKITRVHNPNTNEMCAD